MPKKGDGKYQPQVKLFFAGTLLINLLNTSIREGLHAGRDTGDHTVLGGITVAVFIASMFLFLLPPLVGKRCLPVPEAKCAMIAEIVCIPMAYYVGDNLYPALKEYGTSIGCDEVCLEYIQITSMFFLGFATMSLFYSKFFYKYWSIKFDYLVDSTSKYSMWIEITDMIVEMVNIDILYSTLIMLGMKYTSTDSDIYCQGNHISFGVLLYFGCCLIGVSIQGFLIHKACKCTCEHCNKNNPGCTRNNDERKKISIGFGVLICILLVFYLLADNHLPLEYFLCINSSSMNSTSINPQVAISGTRSAISGILFLAAFCIVSVMMKSIIAIVHKQKPKDNMETLLPSTVNAV